MDSLKYKKPGSLLQATGSRNSIDLDISLEAEGDGDDLLDIKEDTRDLWGDSKFKQNKASTVAPNKAAAD